MLTGRKLLLADDSLTIQKVISLTFGDEGLEVIAVGSGADALAQLALAAPDIVLADVHMPGPDGYEVCARVKQDERWRHIPVLLLVGTFEPFNEAEARRVGADDVLTKPFQSIRELVSKVGQLLGGHADEKQADEPLAHEAAHVAPPAAEPPATDDERPAFTWSRARPAAGQAWPPKSGARAGTFNDFDMDDQSIQATQAEELSRPASAEAAAAPFVVQEVEAAGEFAPEGRAEDDERAVVFAEGSQSAAARAQAQSAPEASAAAFSYAGTNMAAPEFDARPDEEDDDGLLDLGETEPAVAMADEFELDLGDEMFMPTQPAPRVLYAEGLATSPAEAAAPLMTAEAAHTDARALEADAQAYAQPPQSGQALAQVLPEVGADEPAHAAMPAAYEQSARAFAEREVAAPEADTQATTASAPAPAEVSTPAPAALAGGEQVGAPQLSPEMIDAIARRVVELMSDGNVREVAWEVVPDLAERLIKRRLEEERTQAQ